MEPVIPGAPDRPLLTFYDHATGERTELSAATAANWVAKTANLLVDEFELEPGDDVGIALGTHWTTPLIALACWRVGAVVRLDGEPGRVTFEEEGAPTAAPDRVVVGAGLGARLLEAPAAGALAYGEEVLAFGDHPPAVLVDPDAPALVAEGVRLTQRNLAAAAAALRDWGLTPATRLLVTRPPRTVDGLALGLLAPYLAGSSIVMVREPRPDWFWRAAAAERATAALVPGTALAALPAPDRDHGVQHLLCPAGAPLDAVRAAELRLKVPVAVGHGLPAATCASSLVPADAGPEVRTWLSGFAAPTVGVATSRAEVRVEAADGDRGEVVVRGDVVAPDAGKEYRTGDEGFSATGPDGRPYLFLTGRIGWLAGRARSDAVHRRPAPTASAREGP